MKKLNPKYADVLFKIFLTLIMSFIMSFVITFTNLGITPDFLEKVALAFGAGFVISFPAILIAVPVARRVVKKLTESI